MAAARGLVQAEDGWTVVTKGPSGRRKPPNQQSRQDNDDADADESKLNHKVEELSKRYDKFRNLLRTSRFWVQVRTLLDAQEHTSIDTAVCLGLGSLENSHGLTVNSLWQLVLFQEVADYFQAKNSDHPIARYSQDPKSRAFDKAFLKHIGVDLLGHPAGIDKITDKTFLYDPFLPWAVMLVDVLPGKHPAFYMGSTMGGIIDLVADPSSLTAVMKRRQSERSDNELDQALSWVKGFLENRSKLGLPGEFEHHDLAYRGFLVLVPHS